MLGSEGGLMYLPVYFCRKVRQAVVVYLFGIGRIARKVDMFNAESVGRT
jgi:hypothetical protein